MSDTIINTPNLQLRLQTVEEVLAAIDKLSPEDKAAVSPVWLARVRAATASDPWTHGFSVALKGTGVRIGSAGFKGAPSSKGEVEIAYGIDAAYRGKGFATEVARALTEHAFRDSRVHVVIAHTLPEPNASTRVLSKCGFGHAGEVMDPEDGRVWRWEKLREPIEG